LTLGTDEPAVFGAKAQSACLNQSVPGGKLADERFELALVAAFYVFLTALTRATFQGDTPHYIAGVLQHSSGRDFNFWDAGHLLWRPLIWVLLQIGHAVLRSANVPSLIVILVQSVDWVAGLGCVLLMTRITRRFADTPWAIVTASTLAVSQVFLNYLHTGTAYIPGLFFLLLALDFATSAPASAAGAWRSSVGLGAAAAVAVLLWLPYVLAIPALLLVPLIFRGVNRESAGFTMKATAVCALVGLGTYGVVAAKLRVTSPAEIKTWFDAASHSINHIGGFPRAVFGFVRSWIDVGNDGTQFRRFLLHDPYVHIPAVALLFSGAWKVVLICAFFAAVALKLGFGSKRGRRILTFLVLAFVPVFAFGVKWQGGDMERYVAAFPALLLAAACAFSSRPTIVLKAIGIVFVAALFIVNLSDYFVWVRHTQDRAVEARVSVLRPIPGGSYLMVFPGDPLLDLAASTSQSRSSGPRFRFVMPVVPIGYCYAKKWREIFASTAIDAWHQGGEVWIPRDLLNATPSPRDGWVEGAEPGVRWSAVNHFFLQLQTSEVRGDFAEVPPTPPNTRLLAPLAGGNPTSCR
jgi:hypothetical protein